MLIKESEELRNQISHPTKELKRRQDLWADRFLRWQYTLSQMTNVDLSRLNEPLPESGRS